MYVKACRGGRPWPPAGKPRLTLLGHVPTTVTFGACSQAFGEKNVGACSGPPLRGWFSLFNCDSYATPRAARAGRPDTRSLTLSQAVD